MSQNQYHSPNPTNYQKYPFSLMRENSFSPLSPPSSRPFEDFVNVNDDKNTMSLFTNGNCDYRNGHLSMTHLDPKEFPSLAHRPPTLPPWSMQPPLQQQSSGQHHLSGLPPSAHVSSTYAGSLSPSSNNEAATSIQQSNSGLRNFVSVISGGGGGVNSMYDNYDLSTLSSSSHTNTSTSSQQQQQQQQQHNTNTGSNDSKEFFIEKEDFPALPSQSHSHNLPGAVTSGGGGSSGIVGGGGGGLDSTNKSSDTTTGWAAIGPPSSIKSSSTAAAARHSVLGGQNPLTASSGPMGGGGGGGLPYRPFINTSIPPPTVISAPPPSGPPLISSSSSSTGTTTGGGGVSSHNLQQSTKMLFKNDGIIENVPGSMLQDEFGLCALGIIAHGKSPFVPGEKMQDLFEFEKGKPRPQIFPNLLSPLHTVVPMRPQDMDWLVPEEYHIRHRFHKQLADLNVFKLLDDTLFWIFYNCCGEDAQAVAGKVLHSRNWRYHIVQKLWLMRDPTAPIEQHPYGNSFRETSDYYVWDPLECRRVKRRLTLLHSDLDIPPDMCCEKLQVATSSNLSKQMVPPHGRANLVMSSTQQQQQQSLPLQQQQQQGVGGGQNHPVRYPTAGGGASGGVTSAGVGGSSQISLG